MPFTLHPTTVDDASDITAIFQAAFADDHIMAYFHPGVPASILWERDLRYFRDLVAQDALYGERITKVVDEENNG